MKHMLVFISIAVLSLPAFSQDSYTIRDQRTGRIATVTKNVTRSFRYRDVGCGPGGEYVEVALTGSGWVYPVYLYCPDPQPPVKFERGQTILVTIDDNRFVDYRFIDAADNTLRFSYDPPVLTRGY